jgi:hypothetical protein
MAHFRLTILLLGLLLTGCGGGTPREFLPLTYDYLTKIRLDVADIEIQNAYAPRGPGHKEGLAPVRPADALGQMARDRLLAGGNAGRAVFNIDDASIVQTGNMYNASFAVHLDLYAGDSGGAPRATVTARVHGARPVSDDDTDSVRADLYELTRKMMADMNVELEYQARKGLSGELQSTSPTAPKPDNVQTEDLGAPEKP